MQELFDSGRIVDLILVLMTVEGILLVLAKSRLGVGLNVRGALSVLLPGLGLLLALRAALADQSWTVVAAFLFASLVAHLADLRARMTTSAEPRNRIPSGVPATCRSGVPAWPGNEHRDVRQEIPGIAHEKLP